MLSKLPLLIFLIIYAMKKLHSNEINCTESTNETIKNCSKNHNVSTDQLMGGNLFYTEDIGCDFMSFLGCVLDKLELIKGDHLEVSKLDESCLLGNAVLNKDAVRGCVRGLKKIRGCRSMRSVKTCVQDGFIYRN